jgi:hypothetical protein
MLNLQAVAATASARLERVDDHLGRGRLGRDWDRGGERPRRLPTANGGVGLYMDFGPVAQVVSVWKKTIVDAASLPAALSLWA